MIAKILEEKTREEKKTKQAQNFTEAFEQFIR